MNIDPKPPIVTGSPDAIWLVYGGPEHDDTHAELCEHEDVTWCEDKQFDGDVRYVRADVADAAIAQARRDADQWRALYRRAVNEANGLTNHVKDRPELYRAERNLTAIEAEARALADKLAGGE